MATTYGRAGLDAHVSGFNAVDCFATAARYTARLFLLRHRQGRAERSLWNLATKDSLTGFPTAAICLQWLAMNYRAHRTGETIVTCHVGHLTASNTNDRYGQ